MEVTTRLSPNVSAQKIRDQIVTAFEGWSNYWLYRAKLLRSDVKPTETPWYSDPKVFEEKFEIQLGYDEPDGYEGEGRGRMLITETSVRNGLNVMARDYPERFAAIVDGSADADTADVFIQCAMFGKAIYGDEAPKHCPYSAEFRERLEQFIAEGKKVVAAAQASKK
jgi:hypothetical protein